MKSILIIKLSAMGDIVMASPLIHALRTAYPEGKIVWLVQSGFEELLQTHPSLDKVIVWNKNQWRELWRRKRLLALLKLIIAMRTQLKQHKFDMAIDIQGLLKSAFFAVLSGARTKIGLGSKEGSQWLMNEVILKDPGAPRIGSEYFQLAQHMGLPCEKFPMHLECTHEDHQAAENVLRQEKIAGEFIIFCPFTTRPQKHWFDSHWRQLAEMINHKFEIPCVILGGPQDQDAAINMCRGHDNLISIAGKTKLRQAYAVMTRAKYAVGVDTGLTHMSIAAGVPTIALFGATRPYLDTPGYHSKILYKALPCSPCRRNPICHGRFDCMKSITAEEVVNSINLEIKNTP